MPVDAEVLGNIEVDESLLTGERIRSLNSW